MEVWTSFCDRNARGQHLQCLANHRAFAQEVSMEEMGLCGGMSVVSLCFASGFLDVRGPSSFFQLPTWIILGLCS